MKWEPIETAPKNRTDILLVNSNSRCTVGSWSNTVHGDGETWRDGNHKIISWVTHWMPLPEPPNAKTSHND
jgi:hypothetical protein